jgi:hypothetical protein
MSRSLSQAFIICFILWSSPVMHSLHVVIQVPAARKSKVILGTVTSRILTKMGHLSMSMESMSLPLMTESRSSGRKPEIYTLGSIFRFAAIRH